MNEPAASGSFLRRFPIKARLVALAIVLLLATTGSSLYMRAALTQAQALSENASRIGQSIETVASIHSAFNDLRYWQADLAVSQLVLAESNATEARARLDSGLKTLAATHPDDAHTIADLTAKFDDLAHQAVDAYTDDQRVVGNAHFAEARQVGIEIDKRLKDLQSTLAANAQTARASVLKQFNSATQVALALTALAILVGAVLTYVILRSIIKPLGEIVGAVRGLIAGDTNIVIPPASGDELGRVSEALMLLRQSQAERNRLMQETENQRSRLSDAIESIAEAFTLYDADGKLVVTNERFRDIHPVHVELAARQAPFRDVVTAAAEHIITTDLPPAEWVARRLASHGHRSVRIAELRDGRWLQISERETHDGGFTVVYTDISELRKRQEELEAARDEAQRATQVKSEFLANMSHELRTPLNAIIGYSQILQEDLQDAGQNGFLPDLNKIETAGNHLLGLINGILDLSKIEAGRMEIYKEVFNVAGLVDDVEMLVQPLAAKNDNTLVVNCRDDIGAIESDVTKVKQILLNLLSNASKFTKAGKIELTVEHRPAKDGRILAFSVQDSGIGMTEEQLDRLFQAFSQADSSTSRKFGGTGLGLAISRSFAQMLGGDLTVTSELGKGSCFLFTLPDAATEAEEESVEQVEAAAIAGDGDGPQTVLIVDDDEIARNIIGSHLTRDGFAVLYAKSGMEALDMARRHRPSAITLDIMMPKMDGWSVLVELKKEPELAGIPVIIVSISDDKLLGFTLGASEMLTKPVDRNKLGESVAQLTRPAGIATILIVEDDKTTRGMMSRTVERLGHAAAVTQNGREALQWLETNANPSAILLDLNMPEMNGFEFLTRLRDNDKWNSVPVLVITAQQLSPEERRNLSGGAAQIIAKGRSAHFELSHALRATLGMLQAGTAEKA
jgi:signal transduction histidine kinase/DNA-binding response OmpR family regulator/HAMP domain-containing protein